MIMRREILPLSIFGALAILPLIGSFGTDAFILSTVTRVMIFAIAAVSLDLILGYGAMVSFGHAAFLGIGAYAVGILSAHGIREAAIQIPVALFVSALFALVTGAISLRTKGIYFIMITLAFGQMAYFFGVSLAAYGGDDGMTLPGRSLFFGYNIAASERAFYFLVFSFLVVVYAACRTIVTSRFGRVIRGARENPQRMEAIGFSLFSYQLTIYVIAGTLCGLAGFLLANQTQFVSPAYMTWQRSGELIVMVLLGGLGSLNGAILGAAAFLLLEEGLSHLTEYWKLYFGPFLVLVVLFARGGLMGGFKRLTGMGDGR
jgi:branched-chain amino acid transport system permease protein